MSNKHPYPPTQPFVVDSGDNLDDVLSKMANISFQGRTLGMALNIWERAVRKEARIFLGLSGAMVPAGMRMILVHLIRHSLINCIVTTGANTFHDLHESLGYDHFIGTPFTDDVELRRNRLDRMYDTLADDTEFEQVDQFVMGVIESKGLGGRTFETPAALAQGSPTRRALGHEAVPEEGFFRAGTTASAWFPGIGPADRRDVILVEEAIPLGRFGVLTVLHAQGGSWRLSG